MAHVYCAFSRKLNVESFERGQERGLLVKIGWSAATKENRQTWLREGYEDDPALAGKDDWIIEQRCWWDVGDDACIEDDVLGWFRRRRCDFYELYWPLRNDFRKRYPHLDGWGGLTELMLVCDGLTVVPARWRSSLTPRIVREILLHVSAACLCSGARMGSCGA